MPTPTHPDAAASGVAGGPGSDWDLAEIARLAEQFFGDQFGAHGPNLSPPKASSGGLGPSGSHPVPPPVVAPAPPQVSGSAPAGVPVSAPVAALPERFEPALPVEPFAGESPSLAGAATPSFYFLSETPAYQHPPIGGIGVPARPEQGSWNQGPTPDDHRNRGGGPGANGHAGGLRPEPSPLDHRPPAAVSAPFDAHAVRSQFPILSERVNGRPLVWLDNAATTHKPRAVIDRLSYFYEHENSNIHRAAHELAARATDAYEGARSSVARFLGAPSSDNIVFVRGATEAINLVAAAWGRQHVGRGDDIIVSHLEHHANIVPWQLLAAEVGANLKVIPVDDDGQIRLETLAALLSPRTRLVSVAQVSNALGTVVPVAEVVALAHAAGAKVLIDGAQAVSHLPVNVTALGADFYVFSGHKVFAPSGIGALYGTAEVLDSMGPYQGGGNMIADVTFEHTQYNPPPQRFEAGTGNIADAVGLGAALDWLSALGLAGVAAYEHQLTDYALDGLRCIPGLTLVGTAPAKTSVLSFVLDGFNTTEVGEALNREGIAVRSGHHCAQPILRRFGHEATVRPSLALYNTTDEVDLLVSAVGRLATSRRR